VAQQAGRIEDRIPTFVNRAATATDARVDWMAPADRPFQLKEPTEPFSITVIRGDPNDPVMRGFATTLDEYLENQHALAFIVLKDNQIVYERYLHGTRPEDGLWSMSVAKSVTSVLFGIALEEGLIDSVDDPVTKYLPSLANSAAYRDATLRHVLLMATGVNEDFPRIGGIGNGSASSTETPSFLEFAASLPSDNPPGTVFRYQNVNTQVLGIVLEKVTGMSISEYAEEKIWKKIGAERQGAWVTGKKQQNTCVYSCLQATLRDYARFGLMAMYGGELGGTRVVSREWIQESTTPPPFATPSWNDDGTCQQGYAYQWWLPCERNGTFRANGTRGQAIYIDPANGIVIAQFGAWPDNTPELHNERATFFRAIANQASRRATRSSGD
jgi:CubicO group peptidase (beta-lactamase class C family)